MTDWLTGWSADVKQSLNKNGRVALPKKDEKERRAVDVCEIGRDAVSGRNAAMIRTKM